MSAAGGIGVGIRRRAAALALLCCALVPVAAAPALAQEPHPKPARADAPGQLEPSFGKGGKVTVAFPAGFTGSQGPQYALPFSFTPGHLEMARAPDGKVVVAGATKIVRYLADGKLDASFGSNGTVKVPRPPGGVFVLAAVGVDSAGRIVLAGVSRLVPPNSTPDPVQSSAALMRFNADGSPDASFGSGGTLITDFGLKAPKTSAGPYPDASVGLGGLSLDSQNRIVVTGGVVTQLSTCNIAVDAEGFVTRLTETGAVDPAFGFHLVDGLTRVGKIEPRPGGGYLALASGGPTCTAPEGPESVIIGIDPSGNVDSNFGSFGFRPVRFAYPPLMAVGPAGKVLMMGSPYRKTVGEGKKQHGVRVQRIERLLPSGAADPSLNRTGSVDVDLPKHGSLAALAVDPKGRMVLAGKLGTRLAKSAKNGPRRSTFMVSRLRANGRIDPGFGDRGSITTGFGRASDSFATQVLLAGKGKILVGGGITTPQFASGGGFAIARYRAGK